MHHRAAPLFTYLNTPGRLVPTLTLGLQGVHVAQVACGWRHSIAVTDSAKLYTFGWGKFGQIGHGDNE